MGCWAFPQDAPKEPPPLWQSSSWRLPACWQESSSTSIINKARSQLAKQALVLTIVSARLSRLGTRTLEAQFLGLLLSTRIGQDLALKVLGFRLSSFWRFTSPDDAIGGSRAPGRFKGRFPAVILGQGKRRTRLNSSLALMSGAELVYGCPGLLPL